MVADGIAISTEAVAQDKPQGASALVEAARRALASGDGIAAEMKLRAALAAGAAQSDVAAWMGEAYLDQGDRAGARRWLASGRFSPDSSASGWRALARLERLDGNPEAAGTAFDEALRITPDDPALWVEIGRWRYAGGQHGLAIAAARRAIELDPQNVRALQFMGQLVRDRYGLVGALAWFEKAIMLDRDDVSVLLDYAATLGDLGRSRQTVTLTRRVLELAPGNPQAYYLQAVIAARAGNFDLVRSLLARTKGALEGYPAAVQLRGIAELALGNPQTAGEAFETVLRTRPESARTKDLLVRTIYLSGQYRYATLRFAEDIARGDASPYMLTTVARAYEALGERDRAGALLDAAARPRRATLHVVGRQGAIGRLLAQGQGRAAEAAAETARHANPGSYDALAQAGDVQLALGNAVAAQVRYGEAAAIRMPASLFLRRYAAFVMAGDRRGARQLVEGFLAQNPRNREALRAAAGLAIEDGDYIRAQAILGWLCDNGGARDVQVLSDLALVEAGLGRDDAASATARRAYLLQRASPEATQALGFSLAASGRDPETARALFAKAEAMVGRTRLIAQGREMLKVPARAS
ncbi:tetratricopeptide repeat protein [Novosphingobium profundi]|nr:tetratricopeptide repeat protein [Novosphingobium profundi]